MIATAFPNVEFVRLRENGNWFDIAGTSQAKERLRAMTSEALDTGVFGPVYEL